MILDVMNTCSDASMLTFLNMVKKILLLIQIVVPILLLIYAAFSFVKLVKNPEEKNGIKKITNQFLAAAIVFFVPVLVNVVLIILGESTDFSSCWNQAGTNNPSQSSEYVPVDDTRDRQKLIGSADGYE